MLSDREDGAGRGAPNRALLGDMQSAGYKLFRSGGVVLGYFDRGSWYRGPGPTLLVARLLERAR